MVNITKSMIADNISENFGFSKNLAESLVASIFDEMSSILLNENKMNIPKFGTLEIHQKNERPGMDLNKGTKLIINSRKVVRFIPSRHLKEKINASFILGSYLDTLGFKNGEWE
jgi:nucleoid DNA-binding protein